MGYIKIVQCEDELQAAMAGRIDKTADAARGEKKHLGDFGVDPESATEAVDMVLQCREQSSWDQPVRQSHPMRAIVHEQVEGFFPET